jgi:large subunit ribosomal protein L4
MEIENENFSLRENCIGLIHKIYLSQLKNSRKYLACTKTKSEVRGGGKKPWRQKGTGQARAGSIRSPLWVGGGVIFGPKPRTVIKKINKKEKRLGILSAFYLKRKNFFFLNENIFNDFDKIKTKNLIKLLKDVGSNQSENFFSSKILIILSKPNKNIWLASRNLKNIKITVANCLNIKLLLNTDNIILSDISLNLINLTYGKSYA